MVDLSQVPEGIKPPKCGFKKRSYKMGEEYSPKAIGKVNEILERVKSRQQSADSIVDTESTPEAEQLSKENVNVPEEKVSVPQAVPEPEYEPEPSMKKSAVPEKQDEKKQAEADVATVPKPAEEVEIPAVVQQVINDDEDEQEKADKVKLISAKQKRQKRDIPAEVSKKQVHPNAIRFSPSYTGFPNFGNTYNGKDNDLEY